MFQHSLVELIKLGGFTLVFIVLCSVLVLGIAVERVVGLWRLLDRAQQLAETVKRCLYRGAIAEARTACERSSSAAAEVFLVGFERFGRSTPQALEAAVERERQRVATGLKGQLWVLGTVGATAPFVGLFGTVWGIMRAFNEIGVQKRAGIEVVGPGISEALITTALGIIVGIQAVIFYNYFQARLAKAALELKLMAEEFVEILREQPPATKAATDGEAKAAGEGEETTRPGKAKGKAPPSAAAEESA